MTLRSENPPPPGDHVAIGSGESPNPTTAQLKADIDSGRTGDKIESYDPGLSQLGTDDEAAGRPPSAERIALARKNEVHERWIGGSRKTETAHGQNRWVLPAFFGFIAAAAVTVGGALWLFH